jgi:hypothetical protein
MTIALGHQNLMTLQNTLLSQSKVTCEEVIELQLEEGLSNLSGEGERET